MCIDYVTVGYIFIESVAYLFLSFSIVITALLGSPCLRYVSPGDLGTGLRLKSSRS